MGKSLSHRFLLIVLKLKGLKQAFSQDPIDYKRLREEDVKFPKDNYFKKRNIFQFKISDSTITEMPGSNSSGKLLIFIPGGAFISGPAKHHWDAIKRISKKSDHTIWLCDYPKAPEHKIVEISKNIDDVYNAAIKKYRPDSVTLIGDSVGGTLVIALIQRLIQKKISLPSEIILISPVMDARMSNPLIEKIDKFDPMLSKKGVLSAKKMCVGNGDLKNPLLSPLSSAFNNFPPTTMFLAENDITYPDQLVAARKLNQANGEFDQIIGKEMPHIWPLLPVLKEGKMAMSQIISIIIYK